MRSDVRTGFAAGTAIACAGLVLVPLLRTRVHAVAASAGTAEVEVAGFVACGGGGAPRLLLLDDVLGDATADPSACSAWLAARPALLAEIRERLATVGARRVAGTRGRRGR